MAKISTYPLDSNPKLSDKLIGTSVGLNQIGNLENPTYNFSLQQLLDLFSPLLPGNTLQGVLDNNNTATQDINLFGKITTEDLEVTNIANIFSAYISDSLYIEGELFDKNNSQGTAGQILTSTGDGIEWITPSNVIPTLQEVLTSGNEADVDMILTADITAEKITANDILVQDSFELNGTFLDSVGATGVSGQMLISLGTGVLWQDVPVYTASSPLFINPATKNITIQQANGTQNGYLSFADWITFDGKQNALSGTGIVFSNGGTISYIVNNSSNWNQAYNDSIVSATVTGTGTKTLTLTQRDGDTITASWTESGGGGGISSIGLTMPAAFTVTNSPLTSNGVIDVTAAGSASQYVRGDGVLANFPTNTGGGASVSYYLNGSISQGTIGGAAYKQLGNVPIIGAGTDFSISADGYIAQFITDIGNPNKLVIPAGNWNFETYFSASSGGGSPQFYIELYKYDGTTFTLIASNSASPESITGGTNIDLYFSALAVPETTLLATDRLAVRFYVIHSGRTITMHTEDNHLSQVITTFSTGLTALNGLTAQVQYLAVGTAGTDFNISSATDTHTLNLPTASALNRGALSSADWTTFNNKFTLPALTSGSVLFSNGTTIAQDNANFFWDDTNNRLSIGGSTGTSALNVKGTTFQLYLESTDQTTSILSVGGTMISYEEVNLSWSAFNGSFQYIISGNSFYLNNILVSDINSGLIIGAPILPNQTSYTTNVGETVIGVRDTSYSTTETGLYLRRGIYCVSGQDTDLLSIVAPNSSIDLVAKIGYGDRFFIAKISVIISWAASIYTYKITSTNTTSLDDADTVNINFNFELVGNEFFVKLQNDSGSDIYANINANIL